MSLISMKKDEFDGFTLPDEEVRKNNDNFMIVGMQAPKRSSSTMVIKDSDN
jgi:hypothetical protein